MLNLQGEWMNGLQERFQSLVDEHYAGLWSYVRVLTGGAAESEDILHEAFLAVFDRLADGRDLGRDLPAWLRGVVRNQVHVWWRQKARLPQDVADRLKLLAEEADDLPERLARKELETTLQQCLSKLPADDRRFVAERYEEGLRVTQLATRWKLNVATARVRLFRLRQALKACLESQLPGATP